MPKSTFPEWAEDGLLATHTHVWGWWRLEPQHAAYKPDSTLAGETAAIERILYSLCEALGGDYDLHLLNVVSMFDADAWEQELYSRLQTNEDGSSRHRTALVGGRGVPGVIAASKSRLANTNVHSTYLGLRLAGRSRLSLNPAVWVESAWNSLNNVYRGEDTPSEAEQNEWREIRDRVSSYFGSRARIVPTEELAWLLSKPMNPVLDHRVNAARWKDHGPILGADAPLLSGGIITTNTGEDRAAGTATVIQTDPHTGLDFQASRITGIVSQQRSFQDINIRHLPGLVADSLPFPVEWSIRGTVRSPENTRKAVNARFVSTKSNFAEAIAAGREDAGVDESKFITIARRKHAVESETPPADFIGYLSVSVVADTPELASKQAHRLKVELSKRNLDLYLDPAEQDTLALQFMPGSRPYLSPRQWRVLSLSAIPAMGLTFDGIVGDKPIANHDKDEFANWRGGFFLGHTTGEFANRPVLFDPHFSTRSTNGAPGIAIAGRTGGGKSACMYSQLYQYAAAGITCVLVDPKDDSKGLGYAWELEGTRRVDVTRAADGAINPFAMFLGEESAEEEIAARLSLATGMLDLLIPNLSDIKRDARDRAMEYMISTPNEEKSLANLAEILSRAAGDSALAEASRSLGSRLRAVGRLPHARLFMKAGESDSVLKVGDGLTVFTLSGVRFPDGAEETLDDAGRIALCLLRAVSAFVYSTMLSLPKWRRKVVAFDEAWALFSSQEGRDLIGRIERLARSYNLAFIIASQRMTDFYMGAVVDAEGKPKSSVLEACSTKLLFANGDTQIPAYRRVMGLPQFTSDNGGTDPLVEQFASYSNGRAVMVDSALRVQEIQVDIPTQRVFDLINSAPETRNEGV